MMTYFIHSTILILFVATSVISQNLEVEGTAKIMQMDPASINAKTVMQEADGTLTTASMSSPTYTIGDYTQGGVVFWTTPDSTHGKVMSCYEIVDVQFSNLTLTEIGGSAQSAVNGAGNTIAITLQDGHTSSAAKLSADFAYEGYDDWYLPSSNEFVTGIIPQKNVLNSVCITNGGEAFEEEAHYWTSTEVGTVFAWHYQISGGGGTCCKDEIHRIRPIRAF